MKRSDRRSIAGSKVWRGAFPCFLAFFLWSCGGAEFDSTVKPLAGSLDEVYFVDPDVTFSAPFDCLISLERNSTSLERNRVPLGDVELLRNPHRTVRPDILTEVEKAQVVTHELETWIWLDSLEEVEIESPDWPQERVRKSSKRQLYWAMKKLPRNGPSGRDGAFRHEYARAKVLEYRYQGSLKFRIPSSWAKDVAIVREMAGENPRFELPFVFSSPDLRGEGVGLVIEGGSEPGQYRVKLSHGSACTRFKDRSG